MHHSSIYNITATTTDHGQRLDKVISKHVVDLSRSRIQALIGAGCLTMSGQVISDCSASVTVGVEYCLVVPPPIETRMEGANIALDIVYEDEVMLVINKQAGLTVHPGSGNHNDTMVNALIAHCGSNLSGVGGVLRPGIVHRLDKDTSGLMVVAKCDLAHASLSAQISSRQLKRIYLALVWGVPQPQIGSINANLGRHPKDRKRMAVVSSNGKVAVTHYRVVQTFGNGLISQVECRLETGRTHQIRVHFSHKGYPLVGDQTYGSAKLKLLSSFPVDIQNEILNFKRQALHSVQIGFNHPVTHEFLEFKAPLPPDLDDLIKKLKVAKQA